MMGPEEQHHRGGKNQKPNTRRDTMTLRSGKSLPLAGDRKDDDVANLSPPRLRPEPSFHETEEGNRYDLGSPDRDLESSQHALGQKRGQSPGGWAQPEAVRRDVMERLRMSVPSESARSNSSNYVVVCCTIVCMQNTEVARSFIRVRISQALRGSMIESLH